jgi:hypothetical protein
MTQIAFEIVETSATESSQVMARDLHDDMAFVR